MIYLRTRKPDAPIPDWLVGYEPRLGYALRVSEAPGLRMISVCKVTQPTPPVDAEWKKLDEDWEVCSQGNIVPEALCRYRSDCMLSPVEDSRGTVWHVPVVLQPNEKPAIDMPLGDNWEPVATPLQKRILACSRWVRESITKAMPDVLEIGPGGTSFSLEMPRAGDAVGALLEYAYHGTAKLWQLLQVVDQTLLGNALCVASGCMPPSEEVRAAIEGAIPDAVA